MRILYDHQVFIFQRFGGVLKCFCELICNMPDNAEVRIAVIESDNEGNERPYLIGWHSCRSLAKCA